MFTKLLKSPMLLCFFLASCAGTPSVTPPDPVLHVVRSNAFFGSANASLVYLDRRLVGPIGPGGHVTTTIPAGSVIVSSNTENIMLDAERGKSYFFELKTMPWMVTPDFIFKEITRDRAQEILGYNLDG